MPDILLFESSSATFDPTYPSNIVVTKGGDCNFVPPGIFKSTCSIDMEWDERGPPSSPPTATASCRARERVLRPSLLFVPLLPLGARALAL